jgi:hypothetical protein
MHEPIPAEDEDIAHQIVGPPSKVSLMKEGSKRLIR